MVWRPGCSTNARLRYNRRMSVLIFLMMAGAAVPSGGKAVGDPAHWLYAGDFPSTEWHKAAVTQYDLMTDAGGRPVKCIVTVGSGSAVIDKVACTSLLARASYTPARDTEGKPIAQAIRGRLEWHPDTNGGNEHRVTADLSVVSPTVPRKAGSASVKLVLIYDAAGKIEQCVVTKAAQVARINGDACTEASRPGLFPGVKDSTGTLIRGLREIEVVFAYGTSRRAVLL